MTATAHALVGGIIAASVPDRVLGLSLSFAAHPILDMVPHWDLGFGWRKKSKVKLFLEATSDLGLGLILTYLLFSQLVPFTYLLMAVIASESWDILEAPYWFLGWNFPPFSWIYDLQSKLQSKLQMPWGLVTQIVIVISLFVISKIPSFITI